MPLQFHVSAPKKLMFLLQNSPLLLQLPFLVLYGLLLFAEFLLLGHALDGVGLQLRRLITHLPNHRLLLLLVLLPLAVELAGVVEYLLLLRGKLLISLALLALLLEEADGLERPLRLNDEGPDLIELILRNLAFGVLLGSFVYFFKQLIDLSLLVYIHF